LSLPPLSLLVVIHSVRTTYPLVDTHHPIPIHELDYIVIKKMSLFRTWTGQSQRSQKSQQSKDVLNETSSLSSDSRPPPPQRHPSRPNLQPVTSNSSNADPLAGHLNHLTERQEGQFQKFKSTLLEKGLYRPGAEGQPPSHDDQTLL
jgi:hypothetical protein